MNIINTEVLFNMTFGERIYRIRTEKGMTQEELAKKAGYKSRSTIAKIEAGERDAPQTMIVALANALDTTPAHLMGWDEPQYGHRIKEVRESKGYDIETLSKKANISVSDLKSYENDEQQPPLEDLNKIAKAFDLSLGEFYWKQFRSKVEQMAQFSNEHNASLAYLFSSKEQDEYVINKLMIYFYKQNLSDKTIANYLGINESEITAWKDGKSSSYFNYIEQLANLVGADMAEFMVDGLRYDGRAPEEITIEIVEKYLFNETNIDKSVLKDVKHYAKIALQMWKDKHPKK